MGQVEDCQTRQAVHAFFAGRVGVLATMHGKEQVISPLLCPALGITLKVPQGFNTDRFGTFTGDIPRAGNQVEALRAKALAAAEQCALTIGVASEGSFSPHPLLPFATLNLELVLLLDRERQLELIGEAATTETNYARRAVKSFAEALEFAYQAGFPAHGMVVKAHELHNQPEDLAKGLNTEAHLEQAVQLALDKSATGQVYVETDMRAHFNPLRMKCIAAATQNLVDKVYNLCPACGYPGRTRTFVRGLPCGLCGEATEQVQGVEHSCSRCGHKTYEADLTQRAADPRWCGHCNP
jgi:ribosomal protein L37E